MRTEAQKGSEYLPDGWADIRFLFAVLEDGAHEQECEVWPQADKTRGFQRGAEASLWHTTFETKV
ncbi:hypothetical protein D4A47_09975 [Anaerotruncus massiliensis (ex Liu et al. 2021)]|uniref:Uncharacterized protein n=1 Tax=Anaerotruncus massiliensis (ex Liu et al. 2021) TaxID=2321404 RepID=A0A498CKN5_9FIRM|nr:hypothetical protein D4A47_09975 [Anaerotruncus massiliensis (ex Liu et al. 2021)]